MDTIPENGDSPLTHGEFVKCWMGLDRRIRTLEITSKVSLAIATAIFIAVIANAFI